MKRDRLASAGLAAFALAALGSLGVPACRQQLAAPVAGAGSATPSRGGTLHLATFVDVRSLDPAVLSEQVGASVVALIAAGLVDYDAAGNVRPDLAARWDIEEGGTLYRFFLREGVRFHDGEELTAEDVKRSVERALHPSTPSSYAGFFEGVREVRVEGRYVVTFVLARPNAAFLALLGQPPLRPVCQSAGTRYAPGWHPCGAGPFKLPPGGWERGQRITLVRHEGYFRPGLPYLDGVELNLVVPVGSQRFKLESAEIDALRDLNQSDLASFQSDARWHPFGGYAAEVETWGESMNVEVPPFDRVEVRRAVASAIDRRKYAMLRPGIVRAATQLLPRDVPGYDPSFEGQRFDFDAARAHMKNAGLEGGWPDPIPYYAYPQSFAEYTGQVLQQDLAPLGLKLEIRLVAYPAYLAITRRRGRSAFSSQGWVQDYPDPSDFFEAVFHSRAIADEDSNNTAFYANGRLDALLDEAHGEMDPTARKRLYREAGRIVCDDAPWAFTHAVSRYEVRQPYVRDYLRHPLWMFDVTRAWLDRGAAIGAPRGRLPKGTP